MERFPAVRKWRKGVTDKEFQTIVQPTNVYRAEKPVESSYGLAFHTVTVCDLASRDFACTATANWVRRGGFSMFAGVGLCLDDRLAVRQRTCEGKLDALQNAARWFGS